MNQISEKDSVEKLELKLIESVKSDQLAELSLDIGESFLDAMMEDGVAQNIPIFGSIYKLGKAAFGIREHYFAKKIYLFLFNIKDVSQNDRIKFLNDLESADDSQHAGETLINLLERFDNMGKPIILSNLLKAKVKDNIDIVNFLRLASIVEKGFLQDIKKLVEYKKGKLFNGHECESLGSLGLIYQSVMDANGKNNIYSITNLGRDLLEFGLNSHA